MTDMKMLKPGDIVNHAGEQYEAKESSDRYMCDGCDFVRNRFCGKPSTIPFCMSESGFLIFKKISPTKEIQTK